MFRRLIAKLWKKRTLLAMDRLARTSQVVVGLAITRSYNEGAGKEAAAAANFLNGQPPSPMHAQFDLPKIHAEALQWLRNDALMRELVVQSRRVSAVIDHESGRADPLTEELLSLLTEFGEEFPEAPHRDTYEALVFRAIGTLPPHIQPQVMRFMESGR